MSEIFRKPEFEAIIGPFSAAILLVRDGEPEFSVVGATVGFVCTLERRFMLTARHVWLGLIEASQRSNRPSYLCTHNAGRLVSLHGIELLSENEELDLAVLSHPFIESLPVRQTNLATHRESAPKACYGAFRWPMGPAVDRDELCFSGYPRELRGIRGTDEINCVSCFVEDRCCVSQLGKIYMTDGGPPRRQLNHQFGTPTLTNLGGISGSPVFAKRNGAAELVGVVVSGPGDEANEPLSTEATANRAIWVSPIHLLRANGRFD